MSAHSTGTLLGEIYARLEYRVILWRGAESGSDVDLLVHDAAVPELSEMLSEAGLSSEAGDPGHVVWTSSAGGGLPLDILAFSAWPSYYPSIPGVASRLQESEPGPPVTSAADRALIFAAEAVAGRPIAKVVHRIRALLDEPRFLDDLRQVAAAEDLEALADLVERPDDLAALARRGRLSYPRAAALATRSAAARAALSARIAGRLGGLETGIMLSRPGSRRRAAAPLLITVSGMDGAGKSTAAELIESRLRAAGLPAEITWARIGGESALLDRLAMPVKRLLRRSGTVADPVAAGGPDIQKVQDPREGQGRRRIVSWAWIVIVAAANASSYRRAASGRRRGTHVICDRWATDAFVDLELRYGRHRLAEAVMRRLSPERDLGILLEIDAHTAARRKPGDQAEHVLVAMEPLYAQRAREEGLVRIDSRRPPAEIERTVSAVVDALLSTR